MSDILSILFQAAMELPETSQERAAMRRAEPFHDRLCELTNEREADEIWFAAVGEGAAESADSFQRGFAMGARLWEQIHAIPCPPREG